MEQRLHQDRPSIKEKIADCLNPKPKRNQFLSSLYNALERKDYEAAMCWDTDGRAFILKNASFITDRILMEEFSGMKFSSFIRQLCYYGFKRVSRRTNVKVYSHEHFRRDGRESLKEIKRNHKDIESDKGVLKEAVSSKKELETTDIAVSSMQKKIDCLQAELERMKTENLNLRSCIRNLTNIPEEKTEFRQNEDIRGGLTRAVSTSLSTGNYQTFFSPQSHHLYTNPDANEDYVLFPPDQSAFIEVYQPDCKIHQPHFTQNFPTGIHDPYQSYRSNSTSEEQNNFLRSKDEKIQENYWDFEAFPENNF